MTEEKNGAHRLEAAWILLEHAEEIIQEIDTKAARYFHSGVVNCYRKEVPGRGYQIVASLSHPAPRTLPAIIGGAAGQMRSALDKMVGALAVLNGRSDEGVNFPFGGPKRQPFPNADHRRRVNKLTDAQKAKIFELKPFLGGDDDLWSLNQLTTKTKHGDGLISVATGPSFNGTSLGFDTPTDMVSGGIVLSSGGVSAVQIPVGEEVALVTVFADPAPVYKGNIGFGLAFNAPAPIQDRPVVPTLRKMHRQVTDIIKEFEDAFF